MRVEAILHKSITRILESTGEWVIQAGCGNLVILSPKSIRDRRFYSAFVKFKCVFLPFALFGPFSTAKQDFPD
jgi:hypothetical protein